MREPTDDRPAASLPPAPIPAFAAWGAATLVAILTTGCQSDSSANTIGNPHSASGAPAEQVAKPETAPIPPKLANFTEQIPGTEVRFDMIAIPGGTFTMGSPADEAERKDDEGPQHRVSLRPFWIGKCEVRWNEYDLWSTTKGDVDGVTRPTPPYVDMTFGMGREEYPAICMTQLAARTYCEWLSKVTGKKYRLPTEAEWEYACRAGTTTAYSFGDDVEKLDEYAWYEDNAEEEYHKVGTKKANPWGVHDMHGNVAEWTLDKYAAYPSGDQDNPLVQPTELYPRAVRGGSWMHPSPQLRSAARMASHEDWKSQDPQVPKSTWYHTDAEFLGFRVVCEPDRR